MAISLFGVARTMYTGTCQGLHQLGPSRWWEDSIIFNLGLVISTRHPRGTLSRAHEASQVPGRKYAVSQRVRHLERDRPKRGRDICSVSATIKRRNLHIASDRKSSYYALHRHTAAVFFHGERCSTGEYFLLQNPLDMFDNHVYSRLILNTTRYDDI